MRGPEQLRRAEKRCSSCNPSIRQASQDRTIASLEARVGLPRDSQFEIRLPVIHVDQQLNRSFSGTAADDNDTGLGDVRVGFAKTLARENGAMPDLIGRVAWDTASGDDNEHEPHDRV